MTGAAAPPPWQTDSAGPETLSALFGTRRFLLILGVLLVAAFPDVLLGGRVFFYRDYGVLAYPTVYYQHERFWQGQVPLWNPLSNCGVPFLAQWGTMALYPGALIYLLFPLPWSLGVFCLGHLALGGLGMYRLARRWTGDGFAASLAGLTFAFNGVTLSCLLWPNYMVALGWMPWVVLLVERAWTEGGRTLVLATLVAALQLLAGVPELVLLTWVVLAALWLVAVAGGVVPRGLAVGRFLGMLLLVLGLAAAQLLPFLDLLAHSQRDPSFATGKWSLPPWGWANFLLPLVHCYETTQGLFFQHGQEFFSSTYLGAGVVLLGGWVAFSGRRRRVLLLTALALLGPGLALGENSLLYHWLRLALPFAGVARYAVKFVLLTAFVVPLLAAFAAEAWLGGDAAAAGRGGPAEALTPAALGRWLLAWAVALISLMGRMLWEAYRHPLPLDQWPATWQNALARIGFLALTLFLWWLLRRPARPRLRLLTGFGLLAVVWLDFQTSVPRQNPTVSPGLFSPELNRAAAFPAPGRGRVLISPQAEALLLRSRVAGFADDFIGKRLALWSNLNLIDGVAKVNGSATLQLREQAHVQSSLYAAPTTDLPRLADFLGATRTSSPTNPVEWITRPRALPLVTAGQRPLFVSEAAALQGLQGPGFDGAQVVFLPPEARSVTGVTNGALAKVTVRRFSPERVDLSVRTAAPAWVVVAQSYHHAWQPYVNGKRTRLWVANHAFQAFVVPAGDTEAHLVYEDHYFRAGLAFSLLTAAGCGLLWVVGGRRERAARPA